MLFDDSDVSRVFDPGNPIQADTQSLFGGRLRQIRRGERAVLERSAHLLIYGNLFLGKSSLANFLANRFKLPAIQMIGSGDNFSVVFAKEIQEYVARLSPGLELPIGAPLPLHAPRMDSVLTSLSLRFKEPILVVIDEFDALAPDAQFMVARAMKTLADRSANVTFLLVGVAEAGKALLRNVPTIQKNLAQIRVGPMSRFELADVLGRCFRTIDMSVDADAMDLLTLLPGGYPHYSKSLGGRAARTAKSLESKRVTREMVLAALKGFLDDEWDNTSGGPIGLVERPWDLLNECALTPIDEDGWADWSALSRSGGQNYATTGALDDRLKSELE